MHICLSQRLMSFNWKQTGEWTFLTSLTLLPCEPSLIDAHVQQARLGDVYHIAADQLNLPK